MKIIIAAVCSLALSMAGILGVNQLSKNTDNTIDQKYIIQNLQNDAEDADRQNVKAPESTTEAIVKEANDTAVKAVKAAPLNYETIKNEKAESAVQTAAGSFKNGQIYVQKIDLSNCNSYDEVVKALQEKGIYGIDKNALQKIGSLEDVCALFGKKPSNPVPTAKPTNPAPTAKPSNPAPTTKPSNPAPTTKPSNPAPTTKPSENNGNSTLQNYADRVLQLVNAERAKAGLPAFTTNATLSAAANKRAQETVQSFSHTRPNGASFSSVLKEYGISYRTAGENIAYGQRSPEEVVNGWMNSPGHRANILNSNFNKIGIGVYQSNGTLYWSQLFTN